MATAVDIEAVKEVPPGCEKGPQAAELIKVDGATAIGVEHADHHLDGVGVKGGVVSVDEGAAKRGLAQLAAAVGIDGHEQRPQGVAVVAIPGGGRGHGRRTLSGGDGRAIVVFRRARAGAVGCRRRRRGVGVASREGWRWLCLLLGIAVAVTVRLHGLVTVIVVAWRRSRSSVVRCRVVR